MASNQVLLQGLAILMTLFLQNILNGLSAGSVYALLAVGIVLIYKSSEVLNFAHGTFAMFATFIAYELAVSRGFSFPIAAFAALVFAFALGAIVYRVTLDRARAGGAHAMVMVTIGMLMIVEGVAGVVWGTDTKEFHHLFVEPKSIQVGELFVSRHDLAILAVALGLVLVLALFFRFTRVGITLRAVSQNEIAAQLMGVRVARVHSLTWGIATALGAVAGLLVVPKLFLDPSMMFAPTLKAFAAAVLGGMGSVAGAIIGAWLLGVIETLVGAYVSTEFQASIAFIIIIVMLTVRPEGLLGKPEVKKV
jgi:branched-chain amino acid transport system permease protein